MASIINVDQINEATSGNGVQIPGHMVQIVQGISTTYTSLGSTGTYVDTNLAATITPKFSSSKILATLHAPIVYRNTEDAVLRLLRGSTNVYQMNLWAGSTNGGYGMLTGSFEFLDSPSTTSATTYKVQMFKDGGDFLFSYSNVVTSTSTLTLTEIAQ
jgi:hypothetical protein